MKKLTLLIIFVGLAIGVSAQEEPKNLKEAMDVAKAHWLIGDWEIKNANGEIAQKKYKWGIENSVILVHSKTNNEYHGVVGFDAGKVVGKYFGNNVVAQVNGWPWDKWELISVHAIPKGIDKLPMGPVTMMRNQLELLGGTKAYYSSEEWAESVRFWQEFAALDDSR